MALSAVTLKADIKAKLVSYIPTITVTNPVTHEPDDTLDKMAQSLAEAIVAHIVSNLTITIPAGTVVIAVSVPYTPNPVPIPCGVL